MEDNLAANGAEANPPSRFSIVLCRQKVLGLRIDPSTVRLQLVEGLDSRSF
ncbi:hypothetical protein QYF36_014560 [Acer negundo]|nr:hypothetical protein QYF36_014560 [Acer negundo]